eukprot:2264684-Alexandrium_andersonii.AAC.1
MQTYWSRALQGTLSKTRMALDTNCRPPIHRVAGAATRLRLGLRAVDGNGVVAHEAPESRQGA